MTERDRRSKYQDLIDKVNKKFQSDEQAFAFLSRIIELKPRYARDQLSIIAKLQEKYSFNELIHGISYCTERSLFLATDYKDTLEYFSTTEDIPTDSSIKLPVKYSIVVADKRPLDVYSSLVKEAECQ